MRQIAIWTVNPAGVLTQINDSSNIELAASRVQVKILTGDRQRVAEASLRDARHRGCQDADRPARALAVRCSAPAANLTWIKEGGRTADILDKGGLAKQTTQACPAQSQCNPKAANDSEEP
jgi:hypothetical protein